MTVKACKFGGTSLADARAVRRAAEIIRADPSRRFIAVSAPGKRSPDDKKITDLLIGWFHLVHDGLEVLAAYQLIRGNPFRRYSPLDFRMDMNIAVTARGARVATRRDNVLVLEVEERDFDVLVTRFDQNRDIVVKVRVLEGSS